MSSKEALDFSRVRFTRDDFWTEKKSLYAMQTKKWLGRYDIYEKEYKSETLATFEYFNQRAEEIMGIENISINGSKTMKQSDVPGLGNENIANILGSDYSNVTCYYFSVGDTKYFIADVCVMYDDIPRQYIYNITESRSMVKDFIK